MPTNRMELIESLDDFSIAPTLADGFLMDEVLVLPEKHCVVIDNIHHHISEKASLLLLVLASFEQAIVSKEAIDAYLWGENTHSKSSVSGLISEIRKVLDDHVDSPKFIKTVPKKGYTLLAKVDPLEANLMSPEVIMAATASPNKQTPQKFLGLIDLEYIKKSSLFKVAGTYVVMAWVLMQVVSVSMPTLNLADWFDKLSLLILVIGFPLVLWYNWSVELKIRKKFVDSRNKDWADKYLKRFAYKDVSYIGVLTLASMVIALFLAEQLYQELNSPELADKQAHKITTELQSNSIAIMPFTHDERISNPELVAVLQSELQILLSQSPDIRVISERVLSSLPNDASLQQIRELSGARYLLEGRIIKSINDEFLSLSLIETTSGHQEWTYRVNMNTEDALGLFELLSRQVYNAVTFLMPNQDKDAIRFRPTQDIEAYDFYVRAKSQLKDSYTLDQLQQAEVLFLQALAKDKDFTQAKIGLCQTYIEQYALSRVTESFSVAQQSCLIEVDSESDQASINIALGRLYLDSGDYTTAINYFDKGLQVTPDNSIALSERARALLGLGQADQAETYF